MQPPRTRTAKYAKKRCAKAAKEAPQKPFFASFAQPLRPLRSKASFHAATENPNRKVRKEKMREGRKGSTSKGLLRILRATFATFAIKSFVPQSHQEPGPQSAPKKDAPRPQKKHLKRFSSRPSRNLCDLCDQELRSTEPPRTRTAKYAKKAARRPQRLCRGFRLSASAPR